MNRPKEKNQIKSRTEEGCPPQKKIVRRRVTDWELLYLVEFLEDPTNFAIVVGKAVKGKSVIGGQTLTKVQVDESDDVDDVAVSNERVEDSVVSHEPDNDENDPNKELYWELNDMEDPEVKPPQTLPTCGSETKTPTKQNKQRKPVGATPYSSKKRSIPAEFPVEEKRAKRDFVTAYSEGQAKILELEIKKYFGLLGPPE
ncbi:unnamed protein product [Aphanomyces euteiches]